MSRYLHAKNKIKSYLDIDMIEDTSTFDEINEKATFILRNYEMPESCSDLLLDIINVTKHAKKRNENQAAKRHQKS